VHRRIGKHISYFATLLAIAAPVKPSHRKKSRVESDRLLV
jgi:hypothetical protein